MLRALEELGDDKSQKGLKYQKRFSCFVIHFFQHLHTDHLDTFICQESPVIVQKLCCRVFVGFEIFMDLYIPI